MSPSAVVFDLGKVLVDFDYGLAAAKLAGKGLSLPDNVRELIDHSPLLYRFETGLMTNEEFYREVCANTGYRGGFEDFCAAFADIFTEIKPMTALQARLKQKKIPSYIFSNTNELAVKHIQRKFPFFSQFDGYIYSYKIGAMKPDAKIYEAMERLSGRRGSEILYLDDRIENVEAGRARGWQVIHHHQPEVTIPLVNKLVPALRLRE